MQQIYAFAKIDNDDARKQVYEAIKEGKSRFGMWDQKVSLKEKYHGKNGFLLRIKKEDWIVHVNSPSYGKCVAVKVSGEYDFDDGIVCEWHKDFKNYIPVDLSSIVEFDRKDKNVLPSVNLAPMRRGQRICQVEDFLKSIENLKSKKYSNESEDLSGVIHLKNKVEKLLPKLTESIHEMNKSKKLEIFLHKIFDSMPNVLSKQNGFGWKSDHGADLIIEFTNPFIGINITTKLVIQVKSYEGDHNDLSAVEQIVEGIKHFDADGGLLITTGNTTEGLEDEIRKKSEEINKTIDLIAGADVARFVLRYAPEVLMGAT